MRNTSAVCWDCFNSGKGGRMELVAQFVFSVSHGCYIGKLMRCPDCGRMVILDIRIPERHYALSPDVELRPGDLIVRSEDLVPILSPRSP